MADLLCAPGDLINRVDQFPSGESDRERPGAQSL
jgi:hypothetical protein